MYLGIDVGTSAIKLCLMGPDGAPRATAEASLTTDHPFEGASEQAPQMWWAGLKRAMADLSSNEIAHVRAVGLSGQMHGAVVLDAAGGPIRPAILWNDGRATAECETLHNRDPNIGHLAGVVPMPGFTAPKLAWLAAHEPAVYRKIAHILLPKDYVGFRLHGRYVTDPSDAAGTLWFDQAQRAWSPHLCRISETDLKWLPDVVQGTAIAGFLTAQASAELGLPKGIPVAAGAGDAAAGAIGIGAIHAEDGFLSLGTSGQLFVTTDHYSPNPDSRVHAFAHTLDGRWFNMAAMLNGARPMAWLAALLRRPIADILAESEGADESVPLFLPYLMGERTPHGDADIRAGFWGLSENTSHGALMRAVVEAIAFTFADAMAALTAAGTRPGHLLAIGGGARSDFLVQTIADVLSLRIGRGDSAAVGPALGAARLAQVAASDGDIADVATKPPITRWFDPDAKRAERLKPRLAGYRALYPALKSVNHAISRC